MKDVREQMLHEAELIIAYKNGKAYIWKDRYGSMQKEPMSVAQAFEHIVGWWKYTRKESE